MLSTHLPLVHVVLEQRRRLLPHEGPLPQVGPHTRVAKGHEQHGKQVRHQEEDDVVTAKRIERILKFYRYY